MIQKSTSFKYEPFPEPLLISAKQLFLNRELYRAVQFSPTAPPGRPLGGGTYWLLMAGTPIRAINSIKILAELQYNNPTSRFKNSGAGSVCTPQTVIITSFRTHRFEIFGTHAISESSNQQPEKRPTFPESLHKKGFRG